LFLLAWPLPVFLAAQALLPAEGPRPPDAVPKGEVRRCTFDKSKVFPGTVRDYWVYVPRQYDPKKPACVYVNQDGVQYNAPAVFDRLVHRKEIPVLVGVFVQPGRVPAPSGKALDRYNRSYEYDGLGDAYARFLLEELLPEVEKKTTSDGRPIRLSHAGNDRAIGGASSGAICAFTAAWERPDAFTRVFSAIGTYVGLRGGNVYPTLVRETEPRPIRVFLQDGSNDLNIYGGDWWMANQEMERALRFAGYEVNHVWGKGGHETRQATEVFPDAMRWLWKGWPAPVKAGAGSEQLREIARPGVGWEQVGAGYGQATGLAVNARGEVFFNDRQAGGSYKVGPDGKVSQLAARGAGESAAAGQAFGPDGQRYITTGGVGRVLVRGAGGKAAVLASGIQGRDLVVRHDGGLLVVGAFEAGRRPGKVWYVSPKGEKRVVDEDAPASVGVTLSPDQSLLYVADGQSRWVYSYQVRPDGSLAHKQRFYHLHVPDTAAGSGAGGMCVDRDGRLYVATRMGVQVCDQAGRVNVILPVPGGRPFDVCLGGKAFDTLFVSCGSRILRRRLRVRGANAFEPPIKPAPPRL
jgi:enterochelin esterase-like enzyme